jgi:hypothetical protein
VGPLRSRPFAEVVEDELVAQKREQSQKDSPKAVGIREVRHIDMCQPETEFPARHKVTVVQRAPSAQAVVDSRRGQGVVDAETDLDLDLLPATCTYINIDRSFGERAGTIRPNAVAYPRQHFGKCSAIGLETL